MFSIDHARRESVAMCTLSWTIITDSAAVVVLKPGCENTGNISVFSGELGGGQAANNSAISLPPSIFGNMSNCMNVGVIAVIYDGVGPLLSVEQLLPTCLPPTATLAHGKW